MTHRKSTVEVGPAGGLGLALIWTALGAMSSGMPWLLLSDERDEYDAAVREQSFIETGCRVIASRIIEQPGKDDGVERVLQVDFSMQEGDDLVEQLSYTYASHTSPGAPIPADRTVPCFYDPNEPRHVVLIRKTPPDGERPSIGLLHAFFMGLGVLMIALGVYTLRTARRAQGP